MRRRTATACPSTRGATSRAPASESAPGRVQRRARSGARGDGAAAVRIGRVRLQLLRADSQGVTVRSGRDAGAAAENTMCWLTAGSASRMGRGVGSSAFRESRMTIANVHGAGVSSVGRRRLPSPSGVFARVTQRDRVANGAEHWSIVTGAACRRTQTSPAISLS